MNTSHWFCIWILSSCCSINKNADINLRIKQENFELFTETHGLNAVKKCHIDLAAKDWIFLAYQVIILLTANLHIIHGAGPITLAGIYYLDGFNAKNKVHFS